MILEKYDKHALAKSKSERTFARRFLTIILGLLFIVPLISFNAQAAYGLQITVQSPKDKYLDPSTTPQSILYSIDIKNTGTSEENVNVTITFQDPAKPAAGWTVNPNKFTVNSLGSGVTETRQVTVTAPTNAFYPDSAQLQVTAFVQENPSITSSDSFIARVSAIYKVDIEVVNNENAKSVNQGSSVTYNLRINNTGNAQDTISLTASGVPAGWVATFTPDSKTINRNSSFTSAMTLTLPSQVKSTVYPISVIATSQGNPSKTDSTSTFTTVNKVYQLSVSVSPSPTREGLPGTNVQYTMIVENLGNADDRVKPGKLNLEGSTWSTFLDKGEQSIPYQTNKSWTLTVSIPDEARDWERAKVKFNATSVYNSTGYDEITTITEVGKSHGVDVYLPFGNTKKSDPGKVVSFQVQITNVGNTNDTVTLSTSGDFTAVVSPNKLIDLGPDIPTLVTLNISVPNDALSGLHYTIITATTGGSLKDNATVTVDVNPKYDVDLQSFGGAYKSGKPAGEVVIYQLKIVNDGTKQDEISLSKGGQKPQWASLSTTVVTIPAKSNSIINISVSIPSGEPINVWFINITGVSSGNSTISDMQAFQIEVLQTYNAHLSTNDDSNSVPAGGTTKYYINVKNTGSGLDDFTLSTWAENPVAATWSSITPSTIKLKANQNTTVIMMVEVPTGGTPKNYNIWVNITSDNDSAVKKSLKTITQVTDRYEVVIAGGEEQTLEAPEKVNVTYMVEVYNFGTSTDSFQISKTGDRTGWAILSTNLINNLPSGQKFILNVTVKINDVNDPVMADGVHNLKLTIESKNDPVTPKASDFIWLNTSLTSTKDASLNPQQDVFDTEPGKTVYFKILVTNTGSATDTFDLEDEGPYKAWGSILTPTVTLGPSQSINVSYKVDVSPDVTRGESPIKLYLLAKSQAANDAVVENITLTININQTYGVKISTTQNEKTTDPGQSVVFTVRIKNEGNDNDTFSLSHSGPGDLGQWQYSEVTLRPAESLNVNYTVEVDPDHDTSDIVITLNASSDGDETDGTYNNLIIKVHVEPKYDVKLGQNGGARKDGKAGVTTKFNLTVKNEGTDKDTFELIVTAPSGFQVTLSTTTLEVQSVVKDPLNSTKYVTVSVDLRIEPPVAVGEYNIIINASSVNDKTAFDIFTFIVDVKATRAVTLFSPTASVQVDAGKNAVFAGIQVKNKGNDVDSFSFYLTGLPVGWTTSPLSPLNNIPPDGTSTFDLTVYTNAETPARIYSFNLTARSIGDPAVEVRTMLIVEVKQVYKVELPASVSQKSVDVGKKVSYPISVKNSGNGVDNIELTLTGADAQYGILYYSPTETGQTIHISPPSGGSLTVYFNVTPPVDYWDIETGDIVIKIEATSLNDPAINPASDFVDVTTKVNHVYDFIVSASGSQSGVPGETKKYSLTINNKGTNPSGDSFNLRVKKITAAPGGVASYWESANTNPFSPLPPISVAKDGQSIVDVNIKIPTPSDLKLVPPGDYIIEIEIKSQGNTNIIRTVNLTMMVTQLYAAEIVEVDPDTSKVDVGGYTDYLLTVKNSGNFRDNISFKVQDDPMEGDQRSWTTITHNNANITSIILAAGEQAVVRFRVRIPGRNETGYPADDPLSVTFKIKVQSSKPNDPNAQEDEVEIFTQINPIYEYTVDRITKQVGKPGDVVQFSIKITNRGTGSDTYTPDLIWGDENWEQYQSGEQFSPASLNLEADKSGTIILFFTIPSKNDIALAKEYMNNVSITSSKTIDITLSFIVKVDKVYDLELTDPASLSKAVNVGNIVTYQFKVRNTGNGQDKYVLDVIDKDTSSGGGGDQSSWASFVLASDPSTPITSVTLNADQSETIIFTIDVPAQDDPNFVELTSDLQMQIKVTSEGGTNLADSFTTITAINPIYSFELTTTAPNNRKEGEPGDKDIVFTLQVRNTGTKTDSYNFRVTSIDESIFTVQDPNSISGLGVDSYGTTTATVQITSDKAKALVGNYTIDITATSTSDAGVSKMITLNVEITPLAGVEISPSSQTDTGEPEEEIDYSVQVRNKGNAQDTFELTLSGTYKDWGMVLDSNENPISEVILSATTLPGSFANIIVRVTIPGTGETKAGQTYPITLKAASTNTENVFSEATISTKVEDFVDLELVYSGSGTAEKTYDPNKKSPKFSFRVTNNGNQDESSVEIRVDDIDPDWDYTPKTLPDTLDPGSSTTFSLEFTIPTDAAVRDYDMQVVVISSVDPTEETDPVTITVTVVKPDLVISSGDISGLDDTQKLKGLVGSQVTISVKVHNEGNSIAESVQVKLYEGNSVKGTTSISSIDPNGNETVTFRWKVVADEVDLKVEAIPLEESNEGNNQETIYLDLRPNFQFDGEKINFSVSNPKPKDKITIKAYIRNNGGDAEDITVTFIYGGKAIDSDTIDIDNGDVGEASVEWDIPDKAGESLTVEVEVEHPDAPKTEKSSKSLKVASGEATGVAGVFTESGMVGMGIGLAIGAILFLLIGLAVGRRAAGRGPQGMAPGGPSFAAFEKQMPEGAEKKAPKGPAPFERTGEEGAPPAAAPFAGPAPSPAEEEAAKPKEIARVRCPKCGKVTDVTSTQRPLQIPCECGTTLMLKK